MILAYILQVVIAASVEAIAEEITKSQPAVVVNTIGPFTRTAPQIVRACLPGSHYLDLGNEIVATTELLARHDEAVAAGRTLVTGAGFGVLATESVALKLCKGMPPAARIRVDAIPMIAEGGIIGEALAATLIDSFGVGGRRYAHGELERTWVGGDFERFTLPSGKEATTVAAPFGELEAAHRASGAAFSVAGSSELPGSLLVRIMLPAVAALMSWPAIANAAKRRLAQVRFEPPVREASWARARVEWPDGAVREGWLRTEDAMDFSVKVAAAVAIRLARGEGRPGAYTPGALFGPGLAEEAGGHFVLDTD